MTFNFSIDPELPLPLKAQLRGLIEYGIACGELEPGARLPSVRDMARRLGVAQMTVIQVYKDLQQAGLLEGRHGQGTFVAASVRSPKPASPGLDLLQGRVDDLIRDALALGFSRSDLAQLMSARLNRVEQARRSMHVALVGVFENVTRDYAADLRKRLPIGDHVSAWTIGKLRQHASLRAKVGAADLILTLANRKLEVAELLKAERRVVGISYIASMQTRMRLAALDPMKRVGLVSTFPEFLPIMKSGVRRFAPQIGVVKATAIGRPDVAALLGEVDVVIFATGADEVPDQVPPGTEAFEYRHVLNPREVAENLLPMLERLRAAAPPSKRSADSLRRQYETERDELDASGGVSCV